LICHTYAINLRSVSFPSSSSPTLDPGLHYHFPRQHNSQSQTNMGHVTTLVPGLHNNFPRQHNSQSTNMGHVTTTISEKGRILLMGTHTAGLEYKAPCLDDRYEIITAGKKKHSG